MGKVYDYDTMIQQLVYDIINHDSSFDDKVYFTKKRVKRMITISKADYCKLRGVN